MANESAAPAAPGDFVSGVLITSDAAKLPPDIAALLDPAVALPHGVSYFEKRYEFREMAFRLVISIILAVVAAAMIPLGFYVLFDTHISTVYAKVDSVPLIFGLLCGLGSWMMFRSIFACYALHRRQQGGECIRRGIFLTPTHFALADDGDTTLIARRVLVAIDGTALTYKTAAGDRHLKLPAALQNDSVQNLQATLVRWYG